MEEVALMYMPSAVAWFLFSRNALPPFLAGMVCGAVTLLFFAQVVALWRLRDHAD